MIKFAFLAHSGDQTLSLEVSLDYRPGKQTQAARRKAVGELLYLLEADEARVDASGEDMVRVDTADGVWIIAEASAGGRGRV